MSKLTLEQLVADPSKFDPTDAEAHAAIMNELGAQEAPPKAKEPAKEPDEDKPKEADDAKKEVAKEAPEEPAKEPAKAEGVLAPDGKSLIPYAELQAAREGRRVAERALSEVTDQVVALNERIKALEEGRADPGQDGKSADEIEAAFATLEEEAPSLVAPLRSAFDALLKQVRAQEDVVSSLKSTAEQTDEEIQKEVSTAVERAIDSQPALVAWRAQEDKRLWKQCQTLDNALREDPEWQDKPFEERFAQVVKSMVALHGDDILPASARPKEAKVETPGLSSAQIKKAAEAKLNEAAPKAITLTDMPAGASPEQDEAERLENISPAQLLAKFDSMTPAQQQAYLRSVST